MKQIRSMLAALAAAVALAGATRAEAQIQKGNTCGNAAIPPQLFSGVVEAPATLDANDDPPAGWNPQSARLTRGGIHYVSGNYVHVRITTDRCTYVSGVQFGTRLLTTTGEDGYGYWAQAAVPQPQDPTQYGHLVRVQFPAVQDGSTDEVTVTLRRSFGTMAPAQHRFTVVRVAAVEGRFVPAPIGIARGEVFNMFGRALYARFNGAANSAVITGSDGEEWRVYGYDPSTLSVNVTASGIGFQFKFKVDELCDPTLRAYGTFTLDPTLGVDWVDGPHVSPSGCEILQLIPFVGAYVSQVIEGDADSGAGAIRTAIEEALSGEIPDATGIPIADVSSEWEQLLVHAVGTEPSVRIRVPYDAFDLERTATVFPSGQAVTLVASGAGMNDYAAGIVPQTTVWSGPNGLPAAGTTTWPNPRALARSGTLPFAGRPVARLLARTVPSLPPDAPAVTYAYTPGCSLPASTHGPSWVRFGVNDTAVDAQRLRGISGATPGYHLRVYFGGTSTTCASTFTPPPPPPNQFD